MITPRLALALAAVVLTAGSLAGCASGGSSPASSSAGSASTGPVVAPVVESANDLQGATVELTVGQVLDIDTGSLAVDSYTGEVADPSIATFTAGRVDGGATFNPGVTGVSAGTTTVTMKNANGGIQNLVFTVKVSAAG